MPNKIIIDGEKIVNSTNWAGKAQEVIEKLDNELFSTINYEDMYAKKYDKDGNEIARVKRAVKRNEIMPTISPAQVITKLNRYLRVYRPMTLDEAKTLIDLDYLDAYGYYLDVISHINTYCTFLGDKQTFSAFCNLSSDVYNQLITDPLYMSVFSSIEDSFVSSNFTVAQAGLVDSKTTIAKLQTKEAGHNLVKSPENVTVIQHNHIDKQLINDRLAKFASMIEKK